ncbi:MAG: hypothetical protein QM652_09410 [Legionella sp.]|uniref:hypothetical protein n=1 Tax=Legionella sp. TaxID=459 RepID=UPI0039E37BB7
MRNMINLPLTLNEFLTQRDQKYRNQLITIPLFNPTQTAQWTLEQKKFFAGLLYHIRGQFINFMWYVANFAPDTITKAIIIDNIKEELGLGNKYSHEQLYGFFTHECGIDIHDEIANETHYLPFAKKFNKDHVKWLVAHDADERIAAFAAYERLDNIDYPFLSECAQSLNISPHGKIFFDVHSAVGHFSAVLEKLLPIWEFNSEKVKEAFDFIYTHQLSMWQQVSAHIFSMQTKKVSI